jgi:uncharacterized protein YdaU (DUF1376 family)
MTNRKEEMKRIWMPLYIGTYLKKTTHLRALESGAYLHLIMAYWLDGRLPNDDRQLATIAKVTDREWRTIKPTMAAFFGPDFSSHERIDEELARAAAVSAKRKDAANVKWAKRDAKGDANVMQMHMQTPCTTDDSLQSQLQSKKEEDCPKRVRTEYPDDFEAFWRAYPKTPIMSKKQTYREWKKLQPESRIAAQEAIPGFLAFLKANPTHSVVHACRFLSEDRAAGFQPEAPSEKGAAFMAERGWEWRENKWQKAGLRVVN